VITTVSSTRCFANSLRPCLARLLRGCLAGLICLLACWPVLAQSSAELRSLRAEQSSDGMYVGANIRIELASAVEDALLKGIALTFVAEAQVRRDRWYWYDKNITQAVRSMRLSYQPLTRRWRLSLSEGGGDLSTGASLSQSFDQLSEALSAVGRISRWKIADGNEIESDSRHNIDFRFRLDTSQLPRPMQIGITGNTDWSIAIQRNLRPEAR
jgi:hypothetical protein